MSSPTAQQHHDEVLGALSALASETGISPERGELVRADRRSSYEHFGLRTPDRRRRVAAGFLFTTQDSASVLATWDEIWNLADNGDVMSRRSIFIGAGSVHAVGLRMTAPSSGARPLGGSGASTTGLTPTTWLGCIRSR